MEALWHISKFVLAVGLVLLLAWVAERLHPRLAGLLGGFPLGTALALLFVGVELSPATAAEAATYAVAGFAPAVVLMTGYGWWARGHGMVRACRALACGICCWGLAAMALVALRPGLLAGLGLTLLAIVAAHLLMRAIPDVLVRLQQRMLWQMVLVRALVAGGLVLLITGLAHVLPVHWTGVMAAFPMTFLPSVMLVHAARGSGPARTMVRHYPAGLGALVCYTLTVAWAYDSLGLFMGTVIGLAVAASWLGGLLYMGQIWERSIQK